MFTWTASDLIGATVDEQGLVTAVGNGTASISAESSGLADTVAITVQQIGATAHITPHFVRISTLGDTVHFQVEVRDAGGASMENAGALQSSNPSVLQVDGLIGTGMGDGEAYVRVEQDSAIDSAKVVVQHMPVGGVPSMTATQWASIPDPGSWVAFAMDFDSDGDLDLLGLENVTGSDPFDSAVSFVAMRNDGVASTLVDVTSEVFVERTEVTGPHFAEVADFNGDGRDDIYIGTTGNDQVDAGERDLLFIQGDDATLLDMTETNLPFRLDFTGHLAQGDVDNDGDIDIIAPRCCGILNPQPDRSELYMNNGLGVFVSRPDLLPMHFKYNGADDAELADVDNDGDLDLLHMGIDGEILEKAFVALYLNDGTGSFSEPTAVRPRGPDRYPGGTVAADFDLDGWVDLVVESSRPDASDAQWHLLLNNRDGTFPETGVPLLVPETAQANDGPADLIDLNQDGWMDLVSWHDAIVLLNRGGGVFEDISYIFPAHLRATWVRWEVADFDGDGRSDMLVIPWPDEWWLVTTSGN